MRASFTGAHADHRPTDFRFARIQREAGIAHLEWEDNLSPPRKSWTVWLATALCWALLLAAVVWEAGK